MKQIGHMGHGSSTVLTFQPGKRMTGIISSKSAKSSIFQHVKSAGLWFQFAPETLNSPEGIPCQAPLP